MMPGTPLEERITKQWGGLGFQGKDPQTDFRGMGMLRFVVHPLTDLQVRISLKNRNTYNTA